MQLICKLCGHESTRSLIPHIFRKHNYNAQRYRDEFGFDLILTIGKRPPIIKPKYKSTSIWQTLYWIERFNFTEEDAILKVKELQRNNGLKGYSSVPKENRYFSLEYWTSRGYTDEEAKQKFNTDQKTRSGRSKKFKGKVHTQESKERISETSKLRIQEHGIENWLKHFGYFGGKSNREIDSYKTIKEEICNSIMANKVIGKYNVDMVVGNKIIEFNGDFWHCNPNFYKADYFHPIKKMFAHEIWNREQNRNYELEELGYKIYILWEYNWIKFRERELENIKSFINDL